MKRYIVLTHNDNGAGCTGVLTRETLLERLNENYWGSDLRIVENLPDDKYLVNTYGCSDLNHGTMLILEVDLVVPKPVRKVEEWDI